MDSLNSIGSTVRCEHGKKPEFISDGIFICLIDYVSLFYATFKGSIMALCYENLLKHRSQNYSLVFTSKQMFISAE